MYNPELNLLKKTAAKEGEPLTKPEEKMYAWYEQNESMRQEKSKRRMFEDMDGFSGVYSPEKIRNDKQWVIAQRQREKERDIAQKAELLELIISKFTDRAEWFGETVIFKTLEFDDRKHGVDIVMEGQQGNGKPVYIAADCTVSRSQEKIDRKVDDITKSIEDDTLSSVEYFESDDGEVKGKIDYVPKVILAVDPARMSELCEECLPATQRKYNVLSNSHFQVFFLRQLEAQLSKQNQLARLPKENMDRHKKEVVDAIENALKYVRGILREKEKTLDRDTIQRGNEEYEESGLENSLAA